jgi:hypothetical protein
MPHAGLRFAVALSLAASSVSGAQTATQVVRFQVTPVSQISVAGTTAPLVINSASPGSAPTSVSAAGGSYAVTTNEANQKITASVNQAMPPGITLEVTLGAPDGAASSGSIALGTAASDVVTGISGVAAPALPIAYRLSATAGASVTTPQSRTVTFTIVAGT